MHGPKRSLARAVRMAAILAIHASASEAHAHGLPIVRALALHPTEARVVATHADSAGFLTPSARAGHFELICNGHVGVLESGNDRVFMLSTRDGRVLVGAFRGLSLASADACGWAQVGPPAAVRGLLQDPQAPESFIALLAPTGDAPARLVSSRDDGQSWSVVHAFAAGERITSLVMAGADRRRLFVTVEQVRPDGSGTDRALATSDDGGSTWRSQSLDLKAFRVVWASAETPGRALLVESRGEAGHRVHLWDVGASSVRPVLDLAVFGGLAARDDDTTLWIGDAEGGLYASRDGGAVFEQIQATRTVTCLAWGHDRLWACADDVREGHFVATSTDEGLTFEPAGRFACVSAAANCGDAVGAVCEHTWMEWARDLAAPCDPPPAPETETPAEAAASAGTGGCATTPARGNAGSAPGAVWLGLGLAALGVRSRRGRRDSAHAPVSRRATMKHT